LFSSDYRNGSAASDAARARAIPMIDYSYRSA
jgi:hypothetical protein